MRKKFILISVLFIFLSYVFVFSVELIKTQRFLSELAGPPVVYKDKLIILTKRGLLQCYNKQTKKIWSYYIENGAISPPSINKRGDIFVPTLRLGLLVFNINGKLIKRVNIKEEIRTTPVIYKNKIILTTINGNIYFLNKRFKIINKIRIKNQSFSSPVFLKSLKSIIIPFKDYLVVSINSVGKILWRYKTKGVNFSSPAISKNGNIYISSMDHNLYKLSPKGNLIWKFKTKRWIISSPVIDRKGNVYFGSYDNNFYSLDSDGNLRWKYKGAGAFNATAVIVKGEKIFVGNSAGEIFEFSNSGKVLWHYKTDDFVREPFTIFKKRLIAGKIDGSVFYFLIREGISEKAQWPKYLGNLRNRGYK